MRPSRADGSQNERERQPRARGPRTRRARRSPRRCTPESIRASSFSASRSFAPPVGGVLATGSPQHRLPSVGEPTQHASLRQRGLAMNAAVRSGAITQKQLAVLKGSEWFDGLEPAVQQAVLASSRVMVLGAGEPVFHSGDPCDGIYCVLSGAVRFGTIAPSGKELIVALVEAPEWFGEIALFDGGVRTTDAWVDVPSALLHLPLRHLTEMLAGDPCLWKHLG